MHTQTVHSAFTLTDVQPLESQSGIGVFARLTVGAVYNHLESWEYSESLKPSPRDDARLPGSENSDGTFGGLAIGAGISVGILTRSGIGLGPFVYSSVMTSVAQLDGNGPDARGDHFSGGITFLYYPGGTQNRFYVLTRFGAASIGSSIYSTRLYGFLTGAGLGVELFSRAGVRWGLQAHVYAIHASEEETLDAETHNYRHRLFFPGVSLTLGVR